MQRLRHLHMSIKIGLKLGYAQAPIKFTFTIVSLQTCQCMYVNMESLHLLIFTLPINFDVSCLTAQYTRHCLHGKRGHKGWQGSQTSDGNFIPLPLINVEHQCTLILTLTIPASACDVIINSNRIGMISGALYIHFTE